MYLNDYELHKISNRRMKEDQRQAALENMALTSRAPFNLFFWTRRVRAILENLDRSDSKREHANGRSTAAISLDREQHEFS
jgi:hypothetical protein